MGHAAFFLSRTQFKEAAIFREASVIQGGLLLSGHVTMCLRVPQVPEWTGVLFFAPEPQETARLTTRFIFIITNCRLVSRSI